jgi:chromosomal replication initiation ATPase DnaA
MNIYAIPGMPEVIDDYIENMFENVFIKTAEEKTNYLMKKVKRINGVEEIKHKSRFTEHKECRFWHLFFRRRLEYMSYGRAGELYGKDHATVIHAEKKILELLCDRYFFEKYKDVIHECIEFSGERIFR